MIGPIGIYEEGKIIELQPGIHKVKILGSWLVQLYGFKVILKEVKGDKVIEWRRNVMGSNDYAYGKKAKNVAVLDIERWTKYSIHFENPHHVKVVILGPFFLGAIFNKKIPNREIKIAIGY